MIRSLLLVCTLMFAGATIAADPPGAWHFERGTSTYVAATSNSDGDTFGQVCYAAERRCYWLVGLKRGCSANATHPVLVNTDTGASTFKIMCRGPSADDRTRYEYAINEFDDIDRLVSTAKRIGLALPLTGDQFLVVRFDLTGSIPAVTAMRQAAEAQMREQAPR